MPACAGVRRFGAASLDLAYVAAARYDGFWERGLKSWDMAAGLLIAKEAGALVEGLNGYPVRSNQIVLTGMPDSNGAFINWGLKVAHDIE